MMERGWERALVASLAGALILASCSQPAAPTTTGGSSATASSGSSTTATTASSGSATVAAQPAAASPAGSPTGGSPTSAGGSAAAAPTPAKSGPSFTFKLASPSPESDISGVAMKHWAQLVSDRTGGRIKFQFFWAGSLLTSTNMFQGVRDGLTDFAVVPTTSMSGAVPDVASFEVPFSYPTDPTLMLQFDRAVEPPLTQILAAAHEQMVFTSPSTLPDPVSCQSKFLDNQQAWNGTLVRAAGKWQTAAVQAWGAKAVVIDLSDAYSAIQRGTANCLLLVYNLVDSTKMYEVAKYVTRIDHSINEEVVTANQDTWNKIPPSDQKIMIDAGHETQQFTVDQIQSMIPTILNHFKSQGVHICTPSQTELNRLRSATQPILDQISKLQTDKGHQIQQISAEYRAKVTKWGPTVGDLTPCPSQ